MPDQAADLKSDIETELDCSIRLNLLIREIRALCASVALGEAPELKSGVVDEM